MSRTWKKVIIWGTVALAGIVALNLFLLLANTSHS